MYPRAIEKSGVLSSSGVSPDVVQIVYAKDLFVECSCVLLPVFRKNCKLRYAVES